MPRSWLYSDSVEHPDVDTAPPSVTITPELQRAMVRDLTRHLCGLWYIRWGLIALGLMSLLLLIASMVIGDVLGALLAFLLAGVGVASVAVYRRLAGRSVALAYPSGARTTAHVTDTSLSSTTAVGTTDAQLVLFTRMRTTQESVLLTVRSSGGSAAVMPRALFSEGDLERLRVGIERANTVRKNSA